MTTDKVKRTTSASYFGFQLIDIVLYSNIK